MIIANYFDDSCCPQYAHKRHKHDKYCPDRFCPNQYDNFFFSGNGNVHHNNENLPNNVHFTVIHNTTSSTSTFASPHSPISVNSSLSSSFTYEYQDNQEHTSYIRLFSAVQ